MKILGFTGSNNRSSINRRLVSHAISLFGNEDSEILGLNEFECMIFSIGNENEFGIPSEIMEFAANIDEAQLLVISLTEHNESYSAAFKNIYDWTSRILNRTVFNEKPILLMTTSIGEKGGASILTATKERLSKDGAEVLETFSLTNYQDNFNDKNGISNTTLSLELIRKINAIKQNKFKDYFKEDKFTCGIDSSKYGSDDSCQY